MAETIEQSEKAIIGSILMDPPASVTKCIAEGVSDTWFRNDAYAAIFATARALYTQKEIENYDATAICGEAQKLAMSEKWSGKDREGKRKHAGRTGGFLEDGNWQEGIIATIDGAAQPGQLGWHIHNLQKEVVRGKVRMAVERAMQNFEMDPQQALAMLADCASSCWLDVVGEKRVDKAKLCAQLEEDEWMSWHMRVDPDNPDKDKDWVPGLKAPWKKLTRIYLGIGKRLHIVAARPSVGKTSFAVNLVRYWADEKVKVFVNSLDMPPEDIIDRLRTEKSRVSITKKRYTPTREDLQRLKDASEWVKEASIEVTEQYYVEDYCAELSMKAKSGACEAAVVDYVQLLNSYAVDNANEYQRVSFVAEYLKRTANQFKLPIVALCQLNRSSNKDEGKEPTLSDLRGSGALEQAASTVVILHRDETTVKKWRENPPYWFYENEEYGKKHAAQNIDAVWVVLAKNQNGPTGRLPFVVNKPYFAWKLGDVEAKTTEVESGYGAAKTVKRDESLKFERFEEDWRHDTWEESLKGRLWPFLDGSGQKQVIIREEVA